MLFVDATVLLVTHAGARPTLPWMVALRRPLLPTAVWRIFPGWAIPQVLPPAGYISTSKLLALVLHPLMPGIALVECIPHSGQLLVRSSRPLPRSGSCFLLMARPHFRALPRVLWAACDRTISHVGHIGPVTPEVVRLLL